MKVKARKIIVSTMRIALGFGVAAFLLNKVFDKKSFLEQINNCDVKYLVALPPLFATVLVLTFVRWRKLLQVLEINLPFWDVFRLGMIGSFFNGSLPGAVSGDVVKIIYVRKHAPDKKTEAILTMFLDRLLGLFGLLTVAIVACMINIQSIMQADGRIKTYAGFVGIVSLLGVCGFLTLLFRTLLMRMPGISHLVNWFEKVFPKSVNDVFKRIVNALDLYRGNLRTVGFAFILSILVHVMNAGMLVCAARGIREDKVSVPEYFLVTQVCNALASIPLSPGGTGVREIITKDFLIRFNSEVDKDKAAVVPILVAMTMYFWFMIGGVFFVIGKTGAVDEPPTTAIIKEAED